MAYDISLKLPQGWVSDLDTYLDESGVEITHLSCHLPNDKLKTDEALIDVYAGPMPEDSTAADQALANYADTVGFDMKADEQAYTFTFTSTGAPKELTFTFAGQTHTLTLQNNTQITIDK